MRCPNPKHKKSYALKTKRTFAEGRTVRRERFCSECKTSYMTIEQFQSDVNNKDREQSEQIRAKENQIEGLREEGEDIKETLCKFHSITSKAFEEVRAGKR